MEYAGMVHALENIHRLLKPYGYLIDIHPILEAPLIKVCQGSNILFVASDPGYDYDEDIRQAEDALKQVNQRDIFVIEHSREFELITYASSITDLRDFWAKVGAYDDTPKDAAVEARRARLFVQVEEIMNATGRGTEITYHERARMTRLNPRP